MKLTILILALFFLSCEKEESKRVPQDEICLEIKSSSPFTVSGNIGKERITRATCGYVVTGESVYVEIRTAQPAYFKISLYKNNKLVAYKANSCADYYYHINHKF